MRRQAFLLIGIVLLIGLVIGFLWSSRLDAPRDAWWQGKNVYVHVEVWEPGREIATLGMTVPKSVLDFLRGAGLPTAISIGDDGGSMRVEFDDFWKRLQRLKEGERLTYEENDATIQIWMDRNERRIPPHRSKERLDSEAPAESSL